MTRQTRGPKDFSKRKGEIGPDGKRKDTTPKKTAGWFREYITLDKEKDVKRVRQLEALILTDNMGLVSKIVRRFIAQWSITTIPTEDLEQAGCMGLIHAIRIYDPSRASFSACAGLWILERIQTCAVKEGFNVKGRLVSSEVFQQMRRIRLLKGREPTAEELGITQKLYDAIQAPATWWVPLETTAGAGEGEDGYDLDGNFEGRELENPETMSYLREIYNKIPPDYSDVFEALVLHGMTPAQVSRDLKLRVDRVLEIQRELQEILRGDLGDSRETADPAA